MCGHVCRDAGKIERYPLYLDILEEFRGAQLYTLPVYFRCANVYLKSSGNDRFFFFGKVRKCAATIFKCSIEYEH